MAKRNDISDKTISKLEHLSPSASTPEKYVLSVTPTAQCVFFSSILRQFMLTEIVSKIEVDEEA